MVVPICGARPIHSLTGPASAVAANASAPTASATIRRLLIHGEIPWRAPALISGASVSETTAAIRIGSRISPPKYRTPPSRMRKIPILAAWLADAQIAYDTADRLRVADDERVSRFAAGVDIVHNILRVFRAWPPANFGGFGQICPS